MTEIRKLGPDFTRRGFLAGTAGLTFAVAVSGARARLIVPALADTLAGANAKKISAWVSIAPDDTVTILTPGAEMGQGSMTGVPVILADEMDADWNKVKLEWAPADAAIYGYRNRYGRSMAIVGSRAVQKYFNAMRIAGAQVRKVLIDAASAEWHVSASELVTEPGVVVHKPSGRRMSYGRIAALASMPAKMPRITKADLKKPAMWHLIGKSQPRRDIPEKVNGTAQYPIDVTLPGMVYASVVHSPVQEGKPESWNEARIKDMKGVIATVKLPMGIAVVADNFVDVMNARRALEVKWTTPKAAGYDSVPALEEAYPKVAADLKAKSKTVASKGDVKAVFAGAAKTFRSEYRSDYGYHAQMEPLNATARLNAAANRIEVWDGSQAPDRTREMVADALGFTPAQVTMHQCYMGGAFGRRSLGDYAVEAALVARAVKKPVKMIWTREEDVGYGMFRPQSFQVIEAALDKSGKVTGWKHGIVGDGRSLLTGGMKIRYYGVPNQLQDLKGTSHGIRLKHWRAVAHNFNVFAIEDAVNRMAEALGIDPIAFRIQNMAMTGKGRGVFEKVAEMSNWTARRPEGRAVGISISERSGSLGAAVVEISLNRRTGRIHVHKVWLAADGGTIVQPEAARANIESGIMYGLSSVLTERITVRGGIVEQSNYNDYRVMRMAEAPEELHVDFVHPTSGKPTGLGELGNPPMPAAIAHAFYRLTGKHLAHMPFTTDRVLAALKA